MRHALLPVLAGFLLLTALLAFSARRSSPGAVPAGVTEPHPDDIAWNRDEATAKRLAKEKKLPLLVSFTADWCEPCHELERQVFSQPQFRARRGKFVGLRFDVSAETSENDKIMRRYSVNGLPAVLLFDREDRLVAGGRFEGVYPLETFLRLIDSL